MDSTGKEAIYHKTKSSEFIFHVSTLLPEEEGGTTEYLSKKRHIGNDIVVIIFSDDPNFVIPDIVSQYNRKKIPANLLNSKFQNLKKTEIFFVIAYTQTENGTNYFCVHTKTKEGIPTFSLPILRVWTLNEEFKSFLFEQRISLPSLIHHPSLSHKFSNKKFTVLRKRRCKDQVSRRE